MEKRQNLIPLLLYYESKKKKTLQFLVAHGIPNERNY